jgi:hypothetical protein
VNENFEIQGHLNCPNCIKYIFSKDNKYLYKISSIFNLNQNQITIDKHSATNFELISTKKTTIFSSTTGLIQYDNEIYLLSRDAITGNNIFVNLGV